MQHNIALCKIILHNSPAESPIFRSESTSFKRQPSPSETFADYSQNDKQIQPFMGFAKKSASNRSCRNAPTRTTPRGKRSFGRYAREAGQPLRGDRRARRRRRRSPSGNVVVLCARQSAWKNRLQKICDGFRFVRRLAASSDFRAETEI